MSNLTFAILLPSRRIDRFEPFAGFCRQICIASITAVCTGKIIAGSAVKLRTISAHIFLFNFRTIKFYISASGWFIIIIHCWVVLELLFFMLCAKDWSLLAFPEEIKPNNSWYEMVNKSLHKPKERVFFFTFSTS